MKAFFKRLAIIFGVILFVIIVLLSILASVFEKQIGEKIITAANEQLKTELRLEAFELSIIRTFPNIGANLKGVEIDGTDGHLLLKTEEISLRASLFSLFKENFEVKSVVIRDGRLHIAYDKRGKTNFDIIKETDKKEEEASNSVINLQYAVLKRMEIDYTDAREKNDVLLFIEAANLSGAFGNEQYQLTSEADLKLDFINLAEERLMGEQLIHYKLGIDINTAKGLYVFKQFELELGELPLQAVGQIQEKGDAYDIDLKLESNGGRLSDLTSLLPSDQQVLLEDIESRGEFGIEASIKGLYSDQKQPKIIADIYLDDGNLSGDRIKASIRDLSFVAHYTNGTKQNSSSSTFNLRDFKGKFGGESFLMNLAIENFDNPKIDLSADGKLAIGALLPFIPDERITDAGGMIDIKNIQLKGRFSDMIRTSKIGRVSLTGELAVNKASLTINKKAIRLNNGNIRLDGNDVSINNLAVQAPGTALIFNGRAYNLLPVIFADSINSKKAEFLFEASLEAEKLDIDELLAFGMPGKEAIQEAEETGQTDALVQNEIEKRAYYSQFFNGTFNAKIAQFNFDKIEGENFEGQLTFDPNEMNIKGQTDAMGGHIQIDGILNMTEQPSLEAKLSCDKILVNEFFRQANNFDQDFLTDANLEGRLDAKFFIQAAWDESGTFLEKDLHVLGGMGITDGRLKDFAMLEDFSSFVDIRDLRDIRFKNLENFFEIKNSTFYLPVMFIQSNALNMTVSGQHTLEQDIAYYIKVNVGQIMADKFRRHNKALKPKPARRNGFFNLHYAVLGNLENYSFSSDKKRVQRDFEESELRKRDIHFALEKALGTVIEFIEEPVDWRDIPEHEEDPDSTDPEFLDMEIEGGQF